MTKIFFDTEFTGLHQETTLISFGAISECGKTFYAEFTDFDYSQIDKWLKLNVIDNLILSDEHNREVSEHEIINSDELNIKGDEDFIASCLKEWLSQFDKVEMWSDCLSYDWVLFVNLFGNAFDIPDNVYYIPFDICTMFKIKGIDTDINRENFAFGEFISEMDTQKHNALWDAKVIMNCHGKLSLL
tara:strand:+ start:19 stop:579 length:561 start_codon:yes stop_codon:yes gene_type:complete